MNKILILILLIPHFSFAVVGNDQGNGGDTQNDRPATQYEILTALSIARVDLIYMANFLERKREMHKPVSLNYESFRAAIRNHDILADSYPCYDQHGDETDASTSSRATDKICINLGRLEKKLKVSDYRAQILGLVAHEYSHFVNANEDEANLFQKRIISLYASTRETPDRTLTVLEMIRAENIIKTALKFENLNPTALYITLSSLHESLFRIYAMELVSEAFNAFSNKQRAQVLQLRMKVSNWNQSICEKILKALDAKNCSDYLDNIYQGQEDVSALRYANFSHPSEPDLINAKIVYKRNESFKKIKEQLRYVLSDLKNIRENAFPTGDPFPKKEN